MSEKVMFESPEAAQFKEGISGWVSRHGRFYGQDEQLARYDGCTHRLCECGQEMSRNYTKCNSCIEKRRAEKYLQLEEVPWDGNSLIHSDVCDEYFCDSDELEDYCIENEVKPEDLRLVLCEPQIAHGISEDHYCDILPEDRTLDDVCPELAVRIDELNRWIREFKPVLSWHPGKKRVSWKLSELTE